MAVHMLVVSSPLLEGTPTPEWGVDAGVHVNEEPVLLAVDAGATTAVGNGAFHQQEPTILREAGKRG